jgi:membrane-bound lytic murein transglycosylase MltF
MFFKIGFIFNNEEKDLLAAFNKNLAEIEENGELQEIYEKYYRNLRNQDCGDSTLEENGFEATAFYR